MLKSYVLDKRDILGRLGGDEEIFVMMVDMYLQDVDSNCAALGGALASGDAMEVQREAHTVKGLLATFSDDAGSEAAFALEQRAKSGDSAGFSEAVADLQARLREVAAVLKTATGLPG